jgi:hypothetical protein
MTTLSEPEVTQEALEFQTSLFYSKEKQFFSEHVFAKYWSDFAQHIWVTKGGSYFCKKKSSTVQKYSCRLKNVKKIGKLK